MTDDLIERLETAEEPTAGLMRAAWAAVHGETVTEENRGAAERYEELVNCRAWESAAWMLVPENFQDCYIARKEWAVPEFAEQPWSVELYRDNHENRPGGGDYGKDWVSGEAETLALALAATCVKAKGSKGDGQP